MWKTLLFDYVCLHCHALALYTSTVAIPYMYYLCHSQLFRKENLTNKTLICLQQELKSVVVLYIC